MHEPRLPEARGPLSEAVLGVLAGPPGPKAFAPDPALADPCGDDLQLALYSCFELHYRSFEGVDPDWEWDPELLTLRRGMERAFLDSLEIQRRDDVEPFEVGALLFDLAAEDPAPELSTYLHERGSLDEFREFMIHRSAYQLKEADPHTWAIPRLHGAPKAAMVEIQADEYGSGDPERAHATLFARSMDALGLDCAYGAYLDLIPGATLATVNLISALGLSRRHRGALTGHLAMFEITSPLPNAKYAKALRRHGFDGGAVEFFDEHVEADSVHENIAAYDLAQGLALQEPDLTPDIIWGAEAMLGLEGRFAEALLDSWDGGRRSLRPAYSGPGGRADDGSGSAGALGAEKSMSL